MKYLFILIIFVSTLAACSGMQHDIEQYLHEGEKIYVGKLDWIIVQPGKNRIMILGKMPYGITQTKCVISWMSPSGEPGSQEFEINRQGPEDVFQFLIHPLEEGQHDFKIITMDSKGNTSIVVEAGGYSYGDIYQSTLTNRKIASVEKTEENARINWLPINNEQFFSCEVEYDKTDHTVGKITVAKNDSGTDLPDYMLEGKVKWRSIYFPDPVSMDVFYTEWEEIQLP